MNRRLLRLFKPDATKIVAFAIAMLVVWLGAMEAAVVFGERPAPPDLERVLGLLPWWKMSLVVGLPGHILLRVLTMIGLNAPRWMSIMLYGVAIYVTVCLCVELIKSVLARSGIRQSKVRSEMPLASTQLR